MGNVHSRQRYYDVAYDALLNARELEYEYGGPPSQGAILAYIDGIICARRMIRDCTPLEANEFCRLAEPVFIRWCDLNTDKFLCQPYHGRCQYPDEFLHDIECRYRVDLPPGVEYPPLPGPPGHHSQSHPLGPPPGRRDVDRSHGGSYYGYSASDSEYSEDEDGAVYSDEEDLYTRSISQASDHGFGAGTRRGGAGHGGASRGGPTVAQGRAPQDNTPQGRASRGGPPGATAASSGIRGDTTAHGRAPRSGASNTRLARGDDDDTAPVHDRASRSGAAHTTRARRDDAARPGASRGSTSDAGVARDDVASTRSGAARGQPPRRRNLQATVSDAASEADFADNGIAAPRGGASRDGTAHSGVSHDGTQASHGGRRRRH